ncbi:DUF899 domain-containing protein [Aestuariispira insulae]|uniref:Putative dithiol-disulfide oxidoreductase (DUF899 family) n=1 Tax=Aestuariispira insulae TaxID=1461337 RepID=A0A3D9HY88_9PROT|nr:thioredoxin family protein [Aestuariispira insulae]RED54385.1 putative dithiol-disulfide oxidoreductase (DUF899 family) [Aestuariispira insulae]
MSVPVIAEQQEWLKARLALLEKEKQLTRDRDEISRLRRELPWVAVKEDYRFETENGPEALSGLFNGKSQLIIYHFMFGPDWQTGCGGCSFWCDHFEGLIVHLAARDIAFVVVSEAPMEKILPFKERMGWTFPWVSSAGSRFNADYQVGFTDRADKSDPVYYNYRETSFPVDQAPGASVFAKDGKGGLYHTYSTYSRGLDILNTAYHLMDLTPKGRDEDPENPSSWLRHHDRYDQ